MWCRHCNREAFSDTCDLCGNSTEYDLPSEIYWCDNCNIPIIKLVNERGKEICPLCSGNMNYLCVDLRPVFPEERLLLEVLFNKPFVYRNSSVWCRHNRYYIDGQTRKVPLSLFDKADTEAIVKQLEKYKEKNSYDSFQEMVSRFLEANKDRLFYLKDEAYSFIRNSASKYPTQNIIVSFSGGKDSTVVSDLVIRALGNPYLVHLFGDTTLEFPSTIEYITRFRANNPRTIFKVAKNNDQDFSSVCEDIGPPARMLRWCCSMFKTGPISRVLENMYKSKEILSFYGIRKHESISRSKYNRIEDDAEAIKIQQQTVASPIFFWKDIDIWLYILGEGLDFNEAYRLGYDRVGCWCCPNNNARAQFLSRIYMPKESKKWRSFLIDFARRIGKADAEVYVDTGKWKARQGGQGLAAADDIIIEFKNCTDEQNARTYQLNRPIDDCFYDLFVPLGKVSKDLGRKLINETIVLDINTKVPILSIQPVTHDGYKYAMKIKTMNVSDNEDLQRMVSYQIRKYNACRKCLKCESLCRYGAITIAKDSYRISDSKCRRCKMCVTAKYLEGGCLMDKYLKTKKE